MELALLHILLLQEAAEIWTLLWDDTVLERRKDRLYNIVQTGVFILIKSHAEAGVDKKESQWFFFSKQEE